MVKAVQEGGRYVEYLEARAPYGHDSFLIESEQQTSAIKKFLERLA
ncbi:MAG: hypothetical protein HXX08_25365 [Chloroflexi bacterium]|uniref:Homoserine O-acetyltransferase n=1 Tax=Candidatus Chlorohelix allophototropha TaxID=3003348 RepID=A0A8T7MAK8_9CHLR|nr:hypothetical protein [Chloroflexota bacterium]WJW69047.1 hypothetical protein OZ401_002639 [Chloroflexota bacterium L227-S17]